ncbi:MAG TPA: hypothetical protein PLZ45_07695 [Ferruginibacter sp.]|nr:hypothetical protein [Chitinophagaceae bacterium]HRI24546.1 hypothetical protein [Ferruginibacter sp.]
MPQPSTNYFVVTTSGEYPVKAGKEHDVNNSIEDWAIANAPQISGALKAGDKDFKILELYLGSDRSGNRIR